MKKAVLFVVLTLCVGCNEFQQINYNKASQQQTDSLSGSRSAQGVWLSSDNTSILQPDGYGLGVHRNRYGQAVTIQPESGGVPGEQLHIQTDAYGLGVHSDQYGRPVQMQPDFGHVPGEQLQIQTDAYGPGVHMDQYGRPVREKQWGQ